MLAGPLPEQVDHRKLANHAGIVEGYIPLNRFTRLIGLLQNDEGEVAVRLSFGKGIGGGTQVTGTISAKGEMICQSCMALFVKSIECQLDVVIVNDESRAEKLPTEQDVLVAEDKLVPLVDLIEDELILAIPMIPRHDQVDCPSRVFSLGEEATQAVLEEDGTTHRPFADLAKSLDKQNKLES